MSLSCEHPGRAHLPLTLQGHPCTASILLSGALARWSTLTSTSLPLRGNYSVLFIFPELAQDFQTLDRTKCQGLLSSSEWVLFCSLCIPVIKHLPYCSKVYSETVLQLSVYPSRRAVVCFCKDGNQTPNCREQAHHSSNELPALLTPELVFTSVSQLDTWLLTTPKRYLPKA